MDRRKAEGPLTARHREKESMFENKWEFLHADSVRKTKTSKNDLTTDEVEFMKERDEYTFQPNQKKSKNGGMEYESRRTDTSSPSRF